MLVSLQPSRGRPRGRYSCSTWHSVETLQWVWAAQNIPPCNLPLHHHPSTTREKGEWRKIMTNWKKKSTCVIFSSCGNNVSIFSLVGFLSLAGRVCLAQAVSRQPGPRLCWAAESRSGKLLAASCITSCPFQWQNLLPLFNRGWQLNLLHRILSMKFTTDEDSLANSYFLK